MIPIKDAKMILEAELKARSDAYYDYLQAGGKGDCAEETWLEALEIAIKALQEPERKWIPKKPIVNSGEPLNIFREYRCSACGARVGEQSYCIQCGQRIDWGGERNDQRRSN